MAKRYTVKEKQKLASAVLRRMESGMSGNKSCREAGVPVRTFLDWVDADEELAAQYARAREDMHDAIAQEIMDISDEEPAMVVDQNGVARYDSAGVQHQRLRVDSRKWLLSKVAPKKYGERLALAGDEEAPLSVIIRGDDVNL